MKLKRVDIIVGIPSYNEANSISFVVKQLDAGLRKFFPKHRCLIVNADNNSEDGTEEIFRETHTITPKKYVPTRYGVRGKGSNMRNIFRMVLAFNAKAAMVVDADLRSITPNWVDSLLSPVLKKGYDFVSPVYWRHKYDATITNMICFPLIYSLLNIPLRQPIGGDYGFSRRMCKYWMEKKWETTTYHYGIDNFMTLNAIFSGFKICQVDLGSKVHKPSAPKLGRMFMEVVYTLINELLINRDKWLGKKPVKMKCDFFGTKKYAKPPNLFVDKEIVRRTAIADYNVYKKFLEKFLSNENFKRIHSQYSSGKINMDHELWANSLFNLMFQFNYRRKHRWKIIKCLKSLYFGRVYSFIQQTKTLDARKAEKEIIKQAKVFSKLKPYLIERLV